MQQRYIKFPVSKDILFSPIPAFDTTNKLLVHLYPSVSLHPDTFQTEVTLYASRKESFSGNVVNVHRLQDENITIREGLASTEVTVVQDYTPWRLHLCNQPLTYEQGLFILQGAVSGFRQLLHRVKTPFLVDRSMIGVDSKGQVKVWWNQHFFRNSFSFMLSSQVKLNQMALSLLDCLTLSMTSQDAEIFRTHLYLGSDLSFVSLEKRIKQLSKGLNLRAIGQNMVFELEQVAYILRKVTEPFNLVPSTSQSFLKASNITLPESMRSKDTADGNITKRIYKDGTAPHHIQKMSIIKTDIENLRQKHKESPNRHLLKHSRSLTNIVSFQKAPPIAKQQSLQIKDILRRSAIVEGTPRLTTSMFLESSPSQIFQPARSQLITPAKSNPEDDCGICTGIKSMRKSQIQSTNSDLRLSKVKSSHMFGYNRELFSTERSTTESQMKQSILRPKFGQSEKRLPNGTYFGSIL